MAFQLRAIVLLFCSGLGGCQEESGPSYDVDAELYIAAFCEALCEKNEACENSWFDGWGQCWSTCRENQFSELEADECFEPRIEYSRCRFDRKSCEEVFDEQTDEELPGYPCYELRQAWDECTPGVRVD